MENKHLSDVINLISDIKHGKLYTSSDIVLCTGKLLETLIANGQWENARELMSLIKIRIKRIKDSLPQEVASSNIMRYMLKVIREEYETASKQKGEGQSLHQLVTTNQTNVLAYTENLSVLKTSLLDHLAEYKAELESSTDNIAAQAPEHIHTNEIILTVGKSTTVEKFLISAAKTRSFQVIVVEGAPFYRGHEMAARLAKTIQTTVISDTAVFAMMSRVNKVIIGTHTVMANGGLRASSGIHLVALAAKYCSVPVIVLAHMFKLTPMYVGSSEQGTFNVCVSPGHVIPYSTGHVLNQVDIANPVFDYVPPELVTLFISHQGGNAPSYVYRLLSELYHPEDYDL